MLWLYIVIIVSVYDQPWVNGWKYEYFPEGSNCNSTLGAGTCKRLQHCEPFVQRKIKYADLRRCSFIGIDEVSCCPTSVGNTPTLPAISSWQLDRTTASPDIGVREVQSPSERPTKRKRIAHNRREGSLCNLSSTRTGICRRISQCEAYLSKAITYAELGRCSFIGFEEVVCCPDEGITTTSTTTEPNPIVKRASQIACDNYRAKVVPKLTLHIIDGDEASPGEYPHIGAMLYTSSQVGQQYDVRCSASLIAERFALTVAHCVAREWPVMVRFGSLEWNPILNSTYRFDAKIKNVIDHENYEMAFNYDDIALLEFTETITFSFSVYPACLHSTNVDLASDVELMVAGWGTTNPSNRSMSDTLMATNQRIIGVVLCNETYHENGLRRRYYRGLLESQCCAVDPSAATRKDSCFGDSGGPLMKHVTETLWELVGLVSFGTGCGESIPSVYTRVSHYLDWIERNVWPDQNT